MILLIFIKDIIIFSNNKCILLLNYPQSLLSSKTPITGKPPKVISLKQQQQQQQRRNIDGDSLDEKMFIIESTEIDDFQQCDDWIKAVPISGTSFEKVDCRNVNNLRELVAYTSKDPEPEKKKNMEPIFISAIVAVVVVISIIVVVVIVLRKRRKADTSNIIMEANEIDADINEFDI